MNWLGYTEAEVWRLTPRKWQELVAVHIDIENQKWGGKSVRSRTTKHDTGQVTGYIDQLGW